MKKRYFWMGISALLACIFFVACGKEEQTEQKDTLTVYTSFYTMSDFASKIGGDKVAVHTMVPDGVEPHDWEPTAKEMADLLKADVFIYNGANFEHWTDKLADLSDAQSLLLVEASQGITLLEEEENLEEEEDHDHGSVDPHVWLDPENAKKEMENIKDAFAKLDPDNATYYQENYEKYATELDALDQKYASDLVLLQNRTIVVSHEAYGYLCKRYGLEQMSIVGLSAGEEPSPARMAEIVTFIKENDIHTIFFEEATGSKSAETIAKETGVEIAVLSPIEMSAGADSDYFSQMNSNLAALKKAGGIVTE